MDSRAIQHRVVKNSFYGILEKGIMLFCPFITRTVLIKTMGADYVGLGSLFQSILQVLNFTELGLGSAIIFSMYDPIAKGDTSKICALLNVYKKFCRCIGCIMLVSGLCVLPGIKFLIKGEYPDAVNIYLLYLIYLFNTTISYFLYAYKATLFNVTERLDVQSKISSACNLLLNLLQIFFFFFFQNYYLYSLMIPFCTILSNIIQAVSIKKMFPAYSAKGNVSHIETKIIIKKLLSLIGFKINSIVILSFDNIIISATFGVYILGLYNNYYYILSSLCGIIIIFLNAIRPMVGKMLVVNTKEENYKLFQKMHFGYNWGISWCSTCLLCLCQPFIEIWLGESFLLDFSVVVILSIYFYVWKMTDFVLVYQDAAGLWDEVKWVPYIQALIKMFLTFIFVKFLGITGGVIATIIGILLVFPFETKKIFPYCFGIEWKNFRMQEIKMLAIAIVVSIASFIITNFIKGEGIIQFIIRILFCIIIPNFLMFLFYKNDDILKNFMKMRWINYKR